jgi:cytoskeletal protein CcmA (bactofilin family)
VFNRKSNDKAGAAVAEDPAQDPVSNAATGVSSLRGRDGNAEAPTRASSKAVMEVCVFGPKTSFEGYLQSASRIHLNGRLSGRVVTPNLLLGATGAIDGVVNAREIKLDGSFEGEIVSGSIKLGESGRFSGKLTTSTLEVMLGAQVVGEVRTHCDYHETDTANSKL